MSRLLVVYDFDKSLCYSLDSDEWLYQHLAGETLRVTNSLGIMKNLMVRAWQEGHTPDDIRRILRRIELDSVTIRTLRYLKRCGHRVVILSNANTISIGEVLQRNAISDCVSEIITNRAYFNGQGRMLISPRMRDSGCLVPGCPPNLCKGEIISQLPNDREVVVFIGDGANDFCAALSLREGDFVLARKDFPLEVRLRHCEILASVFIWETPSDLERFLITRFP